MVSLVARPETLSLATLRVGAGAREGRVGAGGDLNPVGPHEVLLVKRVGLKDIRGAFPCGFFQNDAGTRLSVGAL